MTALIDHHTATFGRSRITKPQRWKKAPKNTTLTVLSSFAKAACPKR